MKRFANRPANSDARADEALVAALSEAARQVAATEPLAAACLAPPPSPLASEGHPGLAASVRSGRRARFGEWHGRTKVLTLSVAALATAILLWGGLRIMRPASPLTYALQGEAVEQGGYIHGVGHAGSEVRFSDGTTIDVTAGTRMSVAAVGPRGARLRLDGGEARFRVAHLPRASWLVEAGPYVIEVTGTVFDVNWSGRDEVIEVVMHSGSVRVGGPLLSEKVNLRAGQRLSARLSSGEIRINQVGDLGAAASSAGRPAVALAHASPSVPAGMPAPAPAPEAPAGGASSAVAPLPLDVRAPAPVARPGRLATRRQNPTVPVQRAPGEAPPADALSEGGAPAPVSPVPFQPPPVSVGPGRPLGAVAALSPHRAPPATSTDGAARWVSRDWAARVAAGDSAAVLADADRLGVAYALRDADSASLSALADAARYSGRHELAATALLEQRRRFPRSRRAEGAAFLLGRMAEDRGDHQGGLHWFRRYLDEAPHGVFAAEAMGGLMLSLERLQGRPAAQSVAREYLRRFPNGTYLLQARALLESTP